MLRLFVFIGWMLSAAPASVHAAQGARTVRLLFLGDSLTEGYGVARERAFPFLVEKSLNSSDILVAQGVRVVVTNAGIGGSTSASAVSRLKWQLKNKPDWVFLCLGGNDGLRGLAVSALEKNLRATIRLAKEHGVRVVLGGMKLPPNFGAKYVRDFEAAYVRLAKEEKTEFIPFILEGVGGDTKLNQDDGIHPNEAGHQRIAQTVQKKFEELLK